MSSHDPFADITLTFNEWVKVVGWVAGEVGRMKKQVEREAQNDDEFAVRRGIVNLERAVEVRQILDSAKGRSV